MTISVESTLTVAAGETLSIPDMVGIDLASTFSSLTIYGTVSVANSAPLGGMAGIRQLNGSIITPSVVTVAEGGSLSVSGSYVSGLAAYSWAPDVANHGLWEVAGSMRAEGVYASDTAFSFINTGVLRVTSGGEAHGVVAQAFVNFENSGSIEVIGGAASVGVNLGEGYKERVFDNQGLISVVDTTAEMDSVAVYAGHAAGRATLVNSGTIQGDYAVRNYLGDTEIIENSGTLKGIVDLGILDDEVHNSGTIVGAVLLGDGDDLYDGADGVQSGGVIDGGAGNDRLFGGAKAEAIVGGEGDDRLVGGKGDDVLDGGSGDDVLDGGDGYDTAVYAGAASGVRVNLSLTGPQNTGGAGTDTLIRMNNLTGSAFADTLIGDQWGNTLIGGKGDDVLDGGAGNDRLDGGDGYDTAVYAGATSGVRVNLSLTGAQNTGGAGIDTLIRMNNITGSAFADVLTGDQWGNTLIGGAGDDILDGGAGNDRLDGGEGFDTAVYAGATSGVKVNLALTGAQNTGGAGTDTLIRIENVTGSAFADTLTGDAAANVLTGGKGDDVLDGGAGDDVLDGGDGYDTAVYAKAASGVTVNLSLTGPQNTGGAGVDTLIRMNHVTGSNFADTLTGDQWGNTLIGGKGDDVLEGGGGNDRLDGGDGYDTASYAGATSGVTVNLSLTGAQNTGGAGIDTLIRMNNITGSAFADVLTGDQWGNTLTGGEGDDVLDGGGGNDRLTGGAGNDVMTGGAGDDLFVFGPAFGHDRIDDFVAGGTDDRLDFSAFAGSGVTWTLTQVGDDAVFTFSDGSTLTLTDVSTASLTHTSTWGWG